MNEYIRNVILQYIQERKEKFYQLFQEDTTPTTNLINNLENLYSNFEKDVLKNTIPHFSACYFQVLLEQENEKNAQQLHEIEKEERKILKRIVNEKIKEGDIERHTQIIEEIQTLKNKIDIIKEVDFSANH